MGRQGGRERLTERRDKASAARNVSVQYAGSVPEEKPTTPLLSTAFSCVTAITMFLNMLKAVFESL